MKQKLKKWILRLTATIVLITGILLTIVLNPTLTYANKTIHHNYTIFHNKPLDASLFTKLDEANVLLSASEIYNADLKLDICLNDGSAYPKLIRGLLGQSFARGFYNKVVLQGNANFNRNYLELNGYKWNLTQLLAHEMIHCYQYHKLGFWKSKPISNIPNWKWEGYAEYISRKKDDQLDLRKNIDRLIATDQTKWEVNFSDSTIAPRTYYESWLQVQYCMDIKKMNYQQILDDTSTEEMVKKEMMNWYEGKNNRYLYYSFNIDSVDWKKKNNYEKIFISLFCETSGPL